MRGLIYKELSVFYKSLDKKLLFIMAGVIVFLMYGIGETTGLWASTMFAYVIAMQNIMSFVVDERAHWKKYQMAMPVNGFVVVVSKYISVVCTLAVSVLGSLLFNFLSCVVFQRFDPAAWRFSVAIAIAIPLIWAGICLPLTYWFGFQSAQIIRIIGIIPIVVLFSYIADTSGLSIVAGSLTPYIFAIFFVLLVFFGISAVISIIGYERRK